jgi:hypothetical protein
VRSQWANHNDDERVCRGANYKMTSNNARSSR